MQYLKQSTAATVTVGPVLDSAGAAYTGMVIGDFNLTKNGTTAAMASAATATHLHNGMYAILFTTGNTDTLGRLDVSCNKATYAMQVCRANVLQATVFDALITNATTAAGGLGDIQRLAGQAITAATGVTFPSSIASPTNITAATGIDVTKWSGTAVGTPDTAGYPKVTIKSGIQVGEIATFAGAVTTVTNLTNAPTAGDLTATMKASVTTAATAATPTVTAGTVSDKTGYALSVTPPTAGQIATAVLTTQMTEAYAADGTAPTVAEALHMVLAATSQYIVSGTSITCKKLDGTTTAMVYTTDDATNPTQRIRTS